MEVRGRTKPGPRHKLRHALSPEPCLEARKAPRRPPALTGCCASPRPENLRGQEHIPHYSRAASPPPPYLRMAYHRPPSRPAGPSPQPPPGATQAARWLDEHLPALAHTGAFTSGTGGEATSCPRAALPLRAQGGITSGGPSPHGSPYLKGAA